MGLTDKLFDKSALAPSKKKFVSNVPKTLLMREWYTREEKGLLLTSFWRFSTVPGFGRPSEFRHDANRLNTLKTGDFDADDDGVGGATGGSTVLKEGG